MRALEQPGRDPIRRRAGCVAVSRGRRRHGDRSQLRRVRVPRPRSAADRVRRAGPGRSGAHQSGEGRAPAERRHRRPRRRTGSRRRRGRSSRSLAASRTSGAVWPRRCFTSPARPRRAPWRSSASCSPPHAPRSAGAESGRRAADQPRRLVTRDRRRISLDALAAHARRHGPHRDLQPRGAARRNADVARADAGLAGAHVGRDRHRQQLDRRHARRGRAARRAGSPFGCAISSKDGRDARARSMRASRRPDGSVLAFTDDDVRVVRGWLDAARGAAARPDPSLAYTGGPVRPIWEADPPAWLDLTRGDLWGTIAIQNHGDAPFVYEEARKVPLGANMAVRRDVFARSAASGRISGAAADGWCSDRKCRSCCCAPDGAGLRGLYVPAMQVHHHMPASRLTRQYFRRWWFGKGVSRAALETDAADHRAWRRSPHDAAHPRRAALHVRIRRARPGRPAARAPARTAGGGVPPRDDGGVLCGVLLVAMAARRASRYRASEASAAPTAASEASAALTARAERAGPHASADFEGRHDRTVIRRHHAAGVARVVDARVDHDRLLARLRIEDVVDAAVLRRAVRRESRRMPYAVPLAVASVHESRYNLLSSAIDVWSGHAFMSPVRIRLSAIVDAHVVTCLACVRRTAASTDRGA